MADTTIEARPRKIFGKKCRYLRRAGITPANLYGAGMESLALQVDARMVSRLAHTLSRNTPVQLSVLGETGPRTAFIWSVHRDPLTDDIVHVDFYHVEATHRMRADVPIVLRGVNPDLEKLDKRIQQLLDVVAVETLPADLPTELLADASGLQEVDDEIKLSDLAISDKVAVLTDPDTIVAKVSGVVAMAEPEAEIVEATAEAAAEEGSE